MAASTIFLWCLAESRLRDNFGVIIFQVIVFPTLVIFLTRNTSPGRALGISLFQVRGQICELWLENQNCPSPKSGSRTRHDCVQYLHCPTLPVCRDSSRNDERLPTRQRDSTSIANESGCGRCYRLDNHATKGNESICTTDCGKLFHKRLQARSASVPEN